MEGDRFCMFWVDGRAVLKYMKDRRNNFISYQILQNPIISYRSDQLWIDFLASSL